MQLTLRTLQDTNMYRLFQTPLPHVPLAGELLHRGLVHQLAARGAASGGATVPTAAER